MRKLPQEHPEVYKHFKEEKFVLKTNAEYYKTDAADIKLEQSIQLLKKGPRGIIGQIKHQAYKHKALSVAITKTYGEISKSILTNADANPLHKELKNRKFSEYDKAVNKVFLFIKERDNPMKALCQ